MRILTDDMLIWSDEEEEWRREIEGSENAAAPEGAPVALPQEGTQDVLERHDDNMVGDLANKVSALKNISISIGNDVREQNRLLNEMDSDFDSGKSLSSATTKRRRYVSRTGERPSIHTSFGGKSIIRQRDRPRNVQGRNHSIKENRIGNMSDRPRYVRLRGLPFSSKEHDIIQFLSGCAVTCVSLPLNQEGRASGEAFVGLKNEEDVEAALAKNKELIQKRYIEVFRISNDELSNAHRRGFISEEGRLVKLRGLPFSASNKDIKDFLTDVDVEEVVIGRNAEGRPSGEAFVRLASKEDVHQALQKNKQHMGKRYIEVYESKPEEINRARGGGMDMRHGGPPPLRDIAPGYPLPLMHGPPMHRMEMDGRPPRGPPMRTPPRGMWDDGMGGGYPPMDRTFPPRPSRIQDEMYEMYEGGARGGPIRATPPSMGMYSRASPYDAPPRPLGGGGGRGGGGEDGVEEFNSPTKILMRGLPYDANAQAIERFFAPLRCYEIKIGFNEERRPSGDGTVEFGTISEAREAMQRHKQTIGSRYIELFQSHDIPPAIRRVRFRRVGGAASIPPAPLTTPSHRTNPAAPIPTGRPPMSGPRYDEREPMMGRGGPPRGPRGGYEEEGGAYGSPAGRGPPSQRDGPPQGGRNGGAYSSFPSREYSGAPTDYRENQGAYGRSSQDPYGPPPPPPPPQDASYGMYETKPTKRELYDEAYGRGGITGYEGYGETASQRGNDPYGGARAAQSHNGSGDYPGYEGYSQGGAAAGGYGGYY